MIDSSFKFTGIAGAMALAISASVVAQDAVQWRVEDGGNGHWYASVATGAPLSWFDAGDAALAAGGHMATVTSQAEYDIVFELAADAETWNGRVGPWLGGYQESGPRIVEPDGGWRWITEEPWFDGWSDEWGEPSNGPPGIPESYLHFIGSPLLSCTQDIPNRHWNDFPENGFGDSCTPAPRGFIIEWSADCNGDGIVDFGQILDGTLPDDDGNGVPDCCDVNEPCDLCLGDITGNGVVDAADLGILLAVWNTDGKNVPEADINGDGTVNAADLGILLGAWGSCQ
jgi:hypothetical protein